MALDRGIRGSEGPTINDHVDHQGSSSFAELHASFQCVFTNRATPDSGKSDAQLNHELNNQPPIYGPDDTTSSAIGDFQKGIKSDSRTRHDLGDAIERAAVGDTTGALQYLRKATSDLNDAGGKIDSGLSKLGDGGQSDGSRTITRGMENEADCSENIQKAEKLLRNGDTDGAIKAMTKGIREVAHRQHQTRDGIASIQNDNNNVIDWQNFGPMDPGAQIPRNISDYNYDRGFLDRSNSNGSTDTSFYSGHNQGDQYFDSQQHVIRPTNGGWNSTQPFTPDNSGYQSYSPGDYNGGGYTGDYTGGYNGGGYNGDYNGGGNGGNSGGGSPFDIFDGLPNPMDIFGGGSGGSGGGSPFDMLPRLPGLPSPSDLFGGGSGGSGGGGPFDMLPRLPGLPNPSDLFGGGSGGSGGGGPFDMLPGLPNPSDLFGGGSGGSGGGGGPFDMLPGLPNPSDLFGGGGSNGGGGGPFDMLPGLPNPSDLLGGGGGGGGLPSPFDIFGGGDDSDSDGDDSWPNPGKGMGDIMKDPTKPIKNLLKPPKSPKDLVHKILDPIGLFG